VADIHLCFTEHFSPKAFELEPLFDDFYFQHAQFTVGKDQEVAASAVRDQEAKAAYFVVKIFELLLAFLYAVVFGVQFVEKQGLNEL
jgi:hypothetical protein